MLKALRPNIKRVAFILSLALCSNFVAYAQRTSCSTKLEALKDPPELFGLRLGMTDEQIKDRLPLVQFGRADEIGVNKTSFNPHYDARVDPKAFESVRTISLDFLDGKLVTLWIGFEDTFKWPKLDAFVENFARSFGLPGEWPAKRMARELSCDGFSVYASMIGGGPSIRVTDEKAQNVIAQRREEAERAAEAVVIADSRNKTYYPADCSGKDDVPATSRIIFKTKEVAEETGYKLAKECQ